MSLWTLDDQVFYLTDYLGGTNDGKDQRDAYRASVDGLMQLVNCHRWNYLYAAGRIVTSEPYSTGTVSYDHTGGAYERMLTLSSGTWPAWARVGTVKIDSVYYEVEERKTSTIITLKSASNPGDDLAAGTSYEITQDTYPLPSDFSSMHGMIDVSNRLELSPIPLDQWLNDRLMYGQTADPECYTVCRDENYIGVQAVKLSPIPSSQRNIDYVYYRNFREPRVIKYVGIPTATVTVAAGSRVATFTGATITSKHLGCALRISDNAALPTGNAGSCPFAYERVIMEVTNSDSVIVDAAFEVAGTNVKFYISDIIDVDQSSMLQAYKWASRKWLANDRKMQNLGDIAAQYTNELKVALGSDQKMFGSEYGSGGLVALLARASSLADIAQ